VGGGRLARALLPGLAAAGWDVTTVSGRGVASDPTLLPPDATLLLLAVPDAALSTLADTLASAPGMRWRGKSILHHAGALGPEVLASLGKRGASVGLLHPLQCLGGMSMAASLLPGSRARIEGTPKARRIAGLLARDLGLVPLRFRHPLKAADRQAYHAAAALLSNDLVALLGLGADLLATTGLDRKEALQALAPLARGTLIQAEREGLGAALTGPVVRGDAETVRGHLRTLGRRLRRAEPIHRLLSLQLLRLSRSESCSPPAPSAREIRRLLGRPAAGGGGGATV
jgi:predicted short-subunit dehydrogenase-like oxidoreductase (DUF2520 family)